MSYDKREKNRRKRKRIQIIIVSIIFLYFVFRSIHSLLANNAKTILPEKETLIEKFSAQGFIIMNETVIRSTSNGELEIFPNEGERISAGIEVSNINSLNDTSSLKQELLQIEESISTLKSTETETKLIITETEKMEDLQEVLINKLQEMTLLGNYDEVYILKEQLALYGHKAKDISFTNTLVGKSLDTLNTRRDIIEKQINSNYIKHYSDSGGIISYMIDGYEEIYSPKDFENYYYDKLKVGKALSKSEVKSSILVGEPIYKIIDNFEWYIALKVEDIKTIEDFKINQNIKIQLKEDKHELKGRIIAINPSGDMAVMILKFNTKLHDYYTTRFPEVDVIRYKIDGLKIPINAIVDRNSVKGVYIKDKSGIVKFRPVIIIGQDPKNVYVDIGDSNANITLDDKEGPVRTITLFDEIFLNTINIKEGQILN